MKFLGYLLMAILTIAAFVTVIQINHGKKNAQLCFESKWKTRDYEVSESNMLTCRSSDNSYQELKRVKPRSPHLDEHKMENSSD